MEAGGTATAAHHRVNKPEFLMIKAVSDHGKDKHAPEVLPWRDYAYAVAAAFAVELLRRGPAPAIKNRTTPVAPHHGTAQRHDPHEAPGDSEKVGSLDRNPTPQADPGGGRVAPEPTRSKRRTMVESAQPRGTRPFRAAGVVLIAGLFVWACALIWKWSQKRISVPPDSSLVGVDTLLHPIDAIYDSGTSPPDSRIYVRPKTPPGFVRKTNEYMLPQYKIGPFCYFHNERGTLCFTTREKCEENQQLTPRMGYFCTDDSHKWCSVMWSRPKPGEENPMVSCSPDKDKCEQERQDLIIDFEKRQPAHLMFEVSFSDRCILSDHTSE
jgi:hypothetical protein